VRRVLVITILILAIGSGGAASILTYRILKNNQVPNLISQPKPAPSLPLVVAAARLPYGTVLEPAHLKVVEWASAVRPAGSVHQHQAYGPGEGPAWH